MTGHSISKISLLVHPLYTFAYLDDPAARLKKNARFVLGLWGNEIRRTAQEPDSVLVIVTPSSKLLKRRPHANTAWFLRKLGKLVSFAHRSLGTRVVVQPGNISGDSLKRLLARRGFSINLERIGVRSFGEYWNMCVFNQSRRLANVLGIPWKKIYEVPELSLGIHSHAIEQLDADRAFEALFSSPRSRTALGEYTQNPRQQAAKLRRKSNRRKPPRPQK
ncbi:MAG: hypothetical protein J4215_01190 [Candidatus Diapherotrites archaeon]|uniref:Uncharacterized protein n=1 Tax=Candidatus Iainarchaeum sp. TaxID=3101447 RepID=A0A8T4L6K6_9ARCH|nr:hypothetical protein [Candidatus Diapherotrites archaeon]